LKGVTALSVASAGPISSSSLSATIIPSSTVSLPRALASIEGKNFEPEVVDHIRSQRIASPHRKLRMCVISAKSPFWLPAISQLGKISWIASSSTEGFDVPTDTRTCQPQDKLMVNQLRDYPVDILFFEHLGPYPEHPAWSSKTIKMIVWLRDRRGFKPPCDSWSRCSWRLKHSDLGGVTTSSTVAQFAVQIDLPGFRPKSRLGIPCELGSVINRVKWGVPCKPRSVDSPPFVIVSKRNPGAFCFTFSLPASFFGSPEARFRGGSGGFRCPWGHHQILLTLAQGTACERHCHSGQDSIGYSEGRRRMVGSLLPEKEQESPLLRPISGGLLFR
jgi:hypothetical protein